MYLCTSKQPKNMQQNYIKYNAETPPKYPKSSTGKERDSETGFSYFGARYYDSDILTGWLSVDPMADKYPSLSPYAYCGWNPVKLVDPDGEEIVPYLIYDDKLKKIEIWDDNNTPDDYNDDLFFGEYDAHNNVASNSKGKWPDGEYEILDKNTSHMHNDAVDSRGIKQDSPNGAYGEGGIFRAKTFTEDGGVFRSGMGIHAGRESKSNFWERITMGCIRTKPDAIEAINDAISQYGPLRSIIIRNNKTSSQSNIVNLINPHKQSAKREIPIFTIIPIIDNTYVYRPF